MTDDHMLSDAEDAEVIPLDIERIPLEYPVKAHGETITYIDLPRRAKGKHLRRVPVDPTTAEIMDMIAEFAQVPPSTLDRMDLVDLNKLLEWNADFFGKLGSRTGRRRPRRK